MAPLPALLLLLGASLITTVNAATPEEVAIGKIPGYQHGQPPRQSDFLTSTFCYCALPGHIPYRKEEAHYFQFEYYNNHQDATFILDHKCEASADDKFTCLNPRSVSETRVDGSEFQGKVCRSWENGLDTKTLDELCYVPHRSKYSSTDDFLTFNNQARNLSPGGRQGPAYQPEELVYDICANYCLVHTGMPILNDSKLAHNHIIIHEDMDDMCLSCEKKVEQRNRRARPKIYIAYKDTHDEENVTI